MADETEKWAKVVRTANIKVGVTSLPDTDLNIQGDRS